MKDAASGCEGQELLQKFLLTDVTFLVYVVCYHEILSTPHVYPQVHSEGLACHWYFNRHPIPPITLGIANRVRTMAKPDQTTSMTVSAQLSATLEAVRRDGSGFWGIYVLWTKQLIHYRPGAALSGRHGDAVNPVSSLCCYHRYMIHNF